MAALPAWWQVKSTTMDKWQPDQALEPAVLSIRRAVCMKPSGTALGQCIPCRNIGNAMSNGFYECPASSSERQRFRYNLPPKTKYISTVKSSGGADPVLNPDVLLQVTRLILLKLGSWSVGSATRMDLRPTLMDLVISGCGGDHVADLQTSKCKIQAMASPFKL